MSRSVDYIFRRSSSCLQAWLHEVTVPICHRSSVNTVRRIQGVSSRSTTTVSVSKSGRCDPLWVTFAEFAESELVPLPNTSQRCRRGRVGQGLNRVERLDNLVVIARQHKFEIDEHIVPRSDTQNRWSILAVLQSGD